MNSITVEVLVKADLNKVWEYWTEPKHIQNWNFASADWECPQATNDLRVGGEFGTTMQAKDGSAGFNFTGTYTEVTHHSSIAYTIIGGRKVSINFSQTEDGVLLIETFDPENENSEELQRFGWQSILNNFKKYTEGN